MDRKYIFFSLFAIIPIFVFAVYPTTSVSEDFRNDGMTGAGHYTVYVSDSFGVHAIRQVPNAVVNNGDNCMAKMLFGSNGGDQVGNSVCIGAINQGFRYMQLDQDAQVLVIDKDLRNPSASAGLNAAAKAGITWNQNSTASTDALSKVTVRLSHTFTNSGADDDIFAVGLFNDTGKSTRGMLSKANFTSVSVTTGSDLTVNYDFEIGGGTVP